MQRTHKRIYMYEFNDKKKKAYDYEETEISSVKNEI